MMSPEGEVLPMPLSAGALHGEPSAAFVCPPHTFLAPLPLRPAYRSAYRPADRPAQECASIEAIGSTGVLADTIEVQQRPPAHCLARRFGLGLH